MVGVSTLGQSLNQIDRLKTLQTQLDTLSQQLSTGKKSSQFKGLNDDVIISQRARADLSYTKTFQRNITLGEIRLDLMINSVSEIQNQTSLALDFVNMEITKGQADLDQVTTAASNAYDAVLDNLNEKDGNTYLFAGTDSGNKPISDSGALDTYILSQLEDWRDEVITTNELIANIQGTGDDPINDTIIGYSSTISSAKNISIRADENTEVDYTVKADEDGFRNVIIALAVLKNLPVDDNGGIYLSDTYDDDGNIIDASQIPPGGTVQPDTEDEITELELQRQDEFFQLYDELAEMLATAKDDVFDSRLYLEDAKGRVKSVDEQLTLEKAAADNLIEDVESIDFNEVAIQLSSVQIQLEASYSVTSAIRRLSLVNFI